MRRRRPGSYKILLLALMALALAGTALADPKFKVLHAFGRNEGGLYDSLVFDQAGNLYGTERGGGDYGSGAVFELTPGKQGLWVKTVLHSFNCNGKEGCAPEAGLVFDAAGDLYGMTSRGGSAFGSVFELEPDAKGWSITVLHDRGQSANLVLDRAGNLYGPMGSVGQYGKSAISELMRSQDWKEKWLYSFCPKEPCVHGWDPWAGVTWGPAGSLYGTTVYGGKSPYCGNVGCGVVFELKPEKNGSWKETVLHSFPAFNGDGSVLYDGVAVDKSGSLYGTTAQGGSTNCGVIFKLSLKTDGTWDETILHDFANQKEGCNANPLTFDQQGNLWGTAQGGTGQQCGGGCGVVSS